MKRSKRAFLLSSLCLHLFDRFATRLIRHAMRDTFPRRGRLRLSYFGYSRRQRKSSESYGTVASLSCHIVVLCRNHRLLRGLLMPGTSLRKNAPPARFSLAHLRPSPSFHSGFDSPKGSLKMTRGLVRRGYSLPFTLSVGYAATSPKG